MAKLCTTPRTTFFCCFLGGLLIFTLVPPAYDILWRSIDESVFFLLNGTIEGSQFFAWFWGWSNSKIFEKYAAALILLTCLSLFIAEQKRNFSLTLAKLISITLLILIAIGISKYLLSSYYHPSPSLVLTPFWDAGNYYSGGSVKVISHNSFPGDHAIVAVFLAAGVSLLFRQRWIAAASFMVAIVITLPRMAGGAHWFTDCFVAAPAFGLILLPWLKVSPLVSWIDELLNGFYKTLLTHFIGPKQN